LSQAHRSRRLAHQSMRQSHTRISESLSHLPAEATPKAFRAEVLRSEEFHPAEQCQLQQAPQWGGWPASHRETAARAGIGGEPSR